MTYINGAELDRVSALDFVRYADNAYQSARASRLRNPDRALQRRSADSSGLQGGPDRRSGAAIRLETGDGVLRARTVIVTVSTNVLAAGTIRFTPDNPDTRDAAARLPLGHAEKVFLPLDDAAEFPEDVRFFGATDRAATGAYQMRPFGRPMIEAYFGGSLVRDLQTAGKAAMIAFACEEIAAGSGHSDHCSFAAARGQQLGSRSARIGFRFARRDGPSKCPIGAEHADPKPHLLCWGSLFDP
jgi:monoamine oxidase